MTQVFLGDDSAAEFEPFAPDEVIEGEPDARAHVIRDSGEPGARVVAGIFRSEPSVAKYVFAMHETVYVLEGEADVEVDGETVSLRPGSIASFAKGATSIWRVKSPLKDVFVLSE
jgi:uncharacterized cupin superfamily protein